VSAPGPLVLVAEDEAPIRRFLVAVLHGAGYRLLEAVTARAALDLARSHHPDLVVLDLGLPDFDGLAVIDALRAEGGPPIVVVSARDQERVKVDALDRGADDYLTKPFGTNELLARVRVALRHRARLAEPGGGATTRFHTGDLDVDLEARRVAVGGGEVRLTATEWRVLEVLVRHAGKVLTHRVLLREAWGPGHGDEAHLVRVHLANLRRKIERDPSRPRHVLTEQGVGYRLAVDVPAEGA